MGELCTKSIKEDELNFDTINEKSGNPNKILPNEIIGGNLDPEARFLAMMRNINFTNAYVKVSFHMYL